MAYKLCVWLAGIVSIRIREMNFYFPKTMPRRRALKNRFRGERIR